MTQRDLESSLEEFFRKRVRLAGGYVVKLAPTTAGLPDRMVVMPGGSIHLIELKADGGRLSPIQVVAHNRLRELGCTVYVLTGREEITTWVRRTVSAAGPQNTRSYTRQVQVT